MKIYNNFLFIFFFYSASLFSYPIDLSQDGPITIPIDQYVNELEFTNLNKNTAYIIKVDGEVTLLDESNHPAIMIEKNSLLIENEDQLDKNDIVVIKMFPSFGLNREVRLEKVILDMDKYPHLDNDRWRAYLDKTKSRTTTSEALKYLSAIAKPKTVLVFGSGTGADALFLTEKGSRVSVLDGTPHAVALSCLRLAAANRLSLLDHALISKIESLDENLGTFEAVTGTATFTFIPRDQIEEVMKDKVFPHIAPSGYFAGDFFGQDHAWSNNETMSFLTVEEVVELFTKNGFKILWFSDTKKSHQTPLSGVVQWHEIEVVAQKHENV